MEEETPKDGETPKEKENEDEGEGEGEFDEGEGEDEDRDYSMKPPKERVMCNVKDLREVMTVSEDSIAFALDNFPIPDERDRVYDDLKAYIQDLVLDFIDGITDVEKAFEILLTNEGEKIDVLSKRVPLLFDKTLDFSRSLGLKAFSSICIAQKYQTSGMIKMKAEIVDYLSEEEKDIVERLCDGIDYQSLDNIGFQVGMVN